MELTPQWVIDIERIIEKNRYYKILALIYFGLYWALMPLLFFVLFPPGFNLLLRVIILIVYTVIFFFFFFFLARKIMPISYQKRFLYRFYLLPKLLDDYNEGDSDIREHKINSIRDTLIKLQNISIGITDILESKYIKGETRGLGRLFVGHQIEFFNKLQELIFRVNYFINRNKKIPENFIDELLDLAEQLHETPEKFEETTTNSLNSLISSLKSIEDGIDPKLKVSQLEALKDKVFGVVETIPHLKLGIYCILLFFTSWLIVIISVSGMNLQVDDQSKLNSALLTWAILIGIFITTKK